MESIKSQAAFNGVGRSVTGRRRMTLAGKTAALVLYGAAVGRGATITAVSPGVVPTSDPNSVFDTNSNPGNSYMLGVDTSFVPEGFDIHDLFGGSLGTYGYEQNDVIFADNQPIGTVETVDVTLASAVSLTNFNLYLHDDGVSGNRSAREFLLYAGGHLVDDVHILDTTGTQSYTSVYGSSYIDISDTLNGAPLTTDYELELVQNQDANGSSGIRGLEFTASGTTTSTSAVPEPNSMLGAAIGGLALLGRRRRVLLA